jgi:hypothetical protein
LEKAAGAQAALPTLPGSKAADFEALLETLKSQAFLAEVEKMKGLGALSENEGRKLSAAVGSLELTMSDKLLRSEMDRIKTTFNKGRERLKKKFKVDAEAPTGPAVQTQTIDFSDL